MPPPAAQSIDATAYRLVHAEATALPSLVVDRYDRWLVVQVLSAGLETMRDPIIGALVEVLQPEGILLRNDVPVRRREGLTGTGAGPWHGPARSRCARAGALPAAPWDGQKTGAFLDQRPNRLLAGDLMLTAAELWTVSPITARSRCTWPGTPPRAGARLQPGRAGARRRQRGAQRAGQYRMARGRCPESLRQMERARERFDAIVLDPPAFAKSRARCRMRFGDTAKSICARMRLPRTGRISPYRLLLLPRPAAAVPRHAD